LAVLQCPFVSNTEGQPELDVGVAAEIPGAAVAEGLINRFSKDCNRLDSVVAADGAGGAEVEAGPECVVEGDLAFVEVHERGGGRHAGEGEDEQRDEGYLLHPVSSILFLYCFPAPISAYAAIAGQQLCA
jgi:hypothetical protein